MSIIADMYMTGCRRLRQWARAGIGRITGTCADTDGVYKAHISMEEGRLLQRAELTALTGLLIKKGVFTEDEFFNECIDEMNELEKLLAKEWPEFEVDPNGKAYIIKDPRALAERMRRERWPQ